MDFDGFSEDDEAGAGVIGRQSPLSEEGDAVAGVRDGFETDTAAGLRLCTWVRFAGGC